MATLFYSVMGEGRGHASRARSMVERLRDRHRIVLYTSFDALDFLRDAYADDPEVEVRETSGLKFHYTADRLDLIKTIRHGLAMWWNLRGVVSEREVEVRRDRPDLVVCDFEPTVARAAHRCGVPVMSLDHQHFMTTYDLSGLPRGLQWWAWAMGWSVWLFGIGQQKTVVSAFYRPPLRRDYKHVTQVGPLLRPAVRARQPSVGDHVLSYLRKSTPPRVLEVLEGSPLPVRVYGLGERPPRGAITFHAINEQTFLDDLATANCIVAAAGNQLMGESLYFGKPILALPEQKHHEQMINAYFVQQLGGGVASTLEGVTAAVFQQFLDDREKYRGQLAASSVRFDGTDEAAAAIEAMLKQTSPASSAR
ncbi:hypothetical protein Pla175_09980 [Pirellulimonas nuda]|uniref:MurG-like transferase n=1 Tax=Pirellulimonas nuda TaxID=2528009 RepID=A0A518D845_9BACT|nr:glycosyltransferase family protein [Pirellulimonas nuda]QDU87633.1 hypothetical protein Pla175_09980 [Pirellulimonas nuda]